jgi:tRNA(Ser,Leu) C12 N-acetylase TAN1
MRDWNVVASVQPEGFRDARRLLARYGEVWKTDFFNVLVLQVAEIPTFLEQLRAQVEEEPGIMNSLGRIVPVTRTFTFASPAEFEERATEAALSWAPELVGKSFHVRMHRRGLRGKLSSQEEEKLLAGALLEVLARGEAQGKIAFEDPDAILAVETVGPRAGLSLWSREELARYPFLGLD